MLQPHPPAHFPRLLLNARHIAKLPQCGVARVVGFHAGFDIQLGLQLDMMPHLFGHLGVELAPVKERPEL
jgi:hypothetical protein